MIGLEFAAALTLVVVGLVLIGIWIGLGIAFDRAERAQCSDLWAQARAREDERARRARMTYLIAPPEPEPLAPWYLPGYADPFPRAGRFAPEVPELPHGPGPRPAASPADLDEAVRRMCRENELYVAALIARTGHAERNYS